MSNFGRRTSTIRSRNYDTSSRNFNRFVNLHRALTFIIGGLVALGVVGTIITYFVAQNTVNSYSECVVTDKDRTTNQDGQSQMRVYTENCGVFIVEDSLIHGQFNSADIYGSIQTGETYDFEAYGFRFGPLSMFPGIIEATPSN